MTKKCIVTGGCGFIGSHLVKRLVDEGWCVLIVDDMSAGNEAALYEKDVKYFVPNWDDPFQGSIWPIPGRPTLIKEDFCHELTLKKYLRGADGECSYVFHLAANPRVEASVANPARTTNDNLQKTLTLMEQCKGLNVRFIFASSSAVYGDTNTFPTPTDAKKRPKSPYGLQKLCVEKFLRLFAELYGLESVALRFANVYGPGATGNSAYSTAIAAWCDKIKNGLPCRFDGDGEQSRDLVYVSDVIEALYLAAVTPLDEKFNVFNVGICRSVSNNEILQHLGDLVKNDFQIVKAPARVGDAKQTKLSIVRTHKKLGWAPYIFPRQGILKTLEWWGIECK